MLTQREIISTLEMLRNENLDVRTVTLGMNLLDCGGSDLSHVRRRIAERIMRLAGQLVPVCDRVGQKYGIPVVNKRIAVSPIAASVRPSRRPSWWSWPAPWMPPPGSQRRLHRRLLGPGGEGDGPR